jgi:hypothetical protein
LNSKDTGNITEAKLIAKFVELGYTVSIVFGDNARYDLIIDNEDGLKRIQCKTGRIRDGRVLFNTASVSPFTNKLNYYTGEIDFFAVYCSDNDKCYLIDVDKMKTSKGILRIEKLYRTYANTLWAKDFEI